MEKNNNWGGRREGAGRRKKDSVPICWKLSKDSRDWIMEQAAQQGVTYGTIIDLLIEVFEEQARR